MTKDAAADALFQQRLDGVASDIEELLDRLLGTKLLAGECARPTRLLEAMRYASLAGGKRFRPFLVVETASLFDCPHNQALQVGSAVEVVHCYSLVHDDLPAMDNDDLRRGRPTTHKAYDEATAILVGDGLLTYAFDIVAREETHPDPAVRLELVLALARAAGLGGMVGGQMLDLCAEGRFAKGVPEALGQSEIETLEAMKTGALLRFACSGGAILGKADRHARLALDRYGAAVGRAFQIADDLLDAEGDPSMVGKVTHKDDAAHKATFVQILGVEGARGKLAELVTDAEDSLAPFGVKADVLRAAARFVAERKH
jgi:farnesyl diphosphate synthase